MSIVVESDIPGTRFVIHRYGVALRLDRQEMEVLQGLIARSLRPVDDECYDTDEEYLEESIDEYV